MTVYYQSLNLVLSSSLQRLRSSQPTEIPCTLLHRLIWCFLLTLPRSFPTPVNPPRRTQSHYSCFERLADLLELLFARLSPNFSGSYSRRRTLPFSRSFALVLLSSRSWGSREQGRYSRLRFFMVLLMTLKELKRQSSSEKEQLSLLFSRNSRRICARQCKSVSISWHSCSLASKKADSSSLACFSMASASRWISAKWLASARSELSRLLRNTSSFLLMTLCAFSTLPRMSLHSSLLSLFSLRRCSSALFSGTTSPYLVRLQRQTEQISSFADLQYIDSGSWCSLQAMLGALLWAVQSASSGVAREERWTLGLLLRRVWGECSLLSLGSESLHLVVRSLWSVLREGERKGLARGWLLEQAAHLCEYLLLLTQWKQILWPQVALSRLQLWRWQVWQLLLSFIGCYRFYQQKQFAYIPTLASFNPRPSPPAG